ncbi:MAG: hypothetical protein LBU17_12465 [Treponema sp.]|jgi:hypothetical protein|nr:hypothetical protein [Treponema sp.]
MKKRACLSLVFVLIALNLSAQFPSNWDTNPPRDTDAVKYTTGISDPCNTEREAFENAWNNVLRNLATGISADINITIETSSQWEGFDSDIEDAHIIYDESSSVLSQVQLTGVKEEARKTERQDGTYIVRVLASISGENYQKAIKSVENEAMAFLVYRFFARKIATLPMLDKKDNPQGFPTYYAWMQSECVTLSIKSDDSAEAYIEQIDIFSKKFHRNVVLYAQSLDNMPSRIIYDAPRYYDGILRALQNTGLFKIVRENSTQLILSPVKPAALNDFKRVVEKMKDASKVFVTGLEVIQTQEGAVVNTRNLVITQFKILAAQKFGMNAVNYNSIIPKEYFTDYLDEDGIIAHIKQNIDTFPARYAVICYAETNLETEILYIEEDTVITASCRFVLYDVVTDKPIPSEPVDTTGFNFVPANLQEQTVLNKGREALRFLCNEENQWGLVSIMAKVLDAL